MRKIRKIVFAAILILVAIITTALAMWLTATDNDKAETIEAITDALSREDEAEREIDWSSLPDSVIAWWKFQEPISTSPSCRLHLMRPMPISIGTRLAKATTEPLILIAIAL